MTESVWLASVPPVDEATSVGVGVVPSSVEPLPPRIIASSPSIKASRPVFAAMARIVEALAGILRFEIDAGLDADAFIGRGIILRRDRKRAAAIGGRNAEAQAATY